jgi:hypothetical protein
MGSDTFAAFCFGTKQQKMCKMFGVVHIFEYLCKQKQRYQ